MSRPQQIPLATTRHCIPEEPAASPPRSTAPSLSYSSSSDEREESPQPRRRRASTILISQNADDVKRLLGQSGTKLIENCCGGGCCLSIPKQEDQIYCRVPLPHNDAFQALQLKLGSMPTTFSGVVDLPPKTVSLLSAKSLPPVSSPTDSAISFAVDDESIDFTPNTEKAESHELEAAIHPPSFVQPHAPYRVFSAKIFAARELTKPGAEKRTWHFDLDVTDYPEEGGVDFKVGGAIGVLAPNNSAMVDELMDLLLIPRTLRDRPVIVKTSTGRWPTVWGDDKARELLSTRRALLQWTIDIQSYPPTKPILRLLAEYASDGNEKKILTFLTSNEGQGAFCDLRTGPHITINQLLHAFPSSKPPLDYLLSTLTQLMPRFYSLSNDPHESCIPAEGCTRLISMAVTVHETPSWDGSIRPGVGSGFFQRQALAFLDASSRGEDPDLRIPMFKGLMANPLAREFAADGPMILIGAGVGIAPFRGFVQRRLKNANCANKVWVLQGVRDSLVDELYSGEWGVHEDEVKRVVQSRRGEAKYVQEEVRNQADLGTLHLSSVITQIS